VKRCQPRLLTPYLDGELGKDIQAQVEEHLRACPSCGALLDEVSIASQRIRGMGRSTVPGATLQRAALVFGERARLDTGRATAVLDEPPPSARLAVEASPYEAFSVEVEPDDFEEESSKTGAIEVDAEPELARLEAVEPELAMPIGRLSAIPDPPAPPEEMLEPISFADAAAALEVEVPPEPESPLRPPWLGEGQLSRADLEESMRAVDRAIEATPEPTANWPDLEAATEPPNAVSAASGRAAETANWPDLDAAGEPPTAVPAPPDLAADARPEPWDRAWTPGGRSVEPKVDPEAAAAAGHVEAAPSQARPAGEPEAAPSHAESALPQTEVPPPVVPVPAPLEAAPSQVWSPATIEPPTPDEVAAAIQAMREQINGDDEDVDEEPAVSASRRAGGVIPLARPRMPTAPPRPFDRLGVPGMAAAGAAIAFVVAAVIVGALALGRPRTAAAPVTHNAPVSTAPSAAVATPAAKPSAAATANSGSLQLTDVVTAGGGGSGYQVTLIRSGVPSSGVFRLVFEISGTGAFPDAKLGKAADGSYYLIANGVRVDPAVVKGWTPKGPISSMTVSGGGGMSLQILLSQPASYSLVYLSSPGRLVIDFK
jgi:hypothetical protein